MKELSQRQRDLIQDLWGIGLTVVPRESYETIFDAAKPPRDMSYQWMDEKREGWASVPFERHVGLFAPYGTTGDIQCDGLWLMERPAAEVAAAHAEAHRKARKNVDDWYARQGAGGFFGGVTIVGDDPNGRSIDHIAVTESGPVRGSQVKIPPDLLPHLSELLRERDRMVSEASKVSIEIPNEELQSKHLLGMKNSCLLMAIDIIRKKYATGEDHGTTESDSTDGSGTSGAEATGTPAESAG